MINYQKIGMICSVLTILLATAASVIGFMKNNLLLGIIWAVFAVMNVAVVIIKVNKQKKDKKK
ncbi:MAG: hypothetical protein MJ105_01895 [Lachnospiraceae bacterium]|nr:hypothetical protein [Lachnospiraceae bacterium]